MLNPAAGAPGDPAGVGVDGGKLLREPTNGLPGLILHRNARDTRIERLTWAGTVTTPVGAITLAGINRVPGLLRNCGGQPGDLPTALPQHDVTCANPNETILLTPQYGAMTPQVLVRRPSWTAPEGS